MKNMDSMNKMGLPSYSISEVVEIYMIIFSIYGYNIFRN